EGIFEKQPSAYPIPIATPGPAPLAPPAVAATAVLAPSSCRLYPPPPPPPPISVGGARPPEPASLHAIKAAPHPHFYFY
uniref:Uncharacterized protein n=1 Tax=Oryza punctata TaxID=4537 RepID=A0A0E0MFY0_ORYPU